MICTIQINNDARDIKRKLDVLRKKCAELKELGVAVAVAYSSSKTNGLFLFEDSRITDVIEAHKEEILLNPDWSEPEAGTECGSSGSSGASHAMILPPLPGPLNQLNGVNP